VKYAEYAQAEHDAGREPLPLGQWRAQRMHDAQQSKLEADREVTFTDPHPSTAHVPVDQSDPAEATALHNEPEPVPATTSVPDMPATMTFFCENRYRVEVMQAGHKTVVGGVVVPVAHRTIDFNEHHWTADMSNPDHREKTEWLMASQAFRRGEIILVPEARPTDRVQVRTGPRTTSTPRMERIERPAGQLSARLDG
jgi:hypothetical protein